MKQFAFAAIIAAASATWEEFNNTALPDLDNDRTSVVGEVGEYMNKWDDGTEQVGMHVRWTTSCNDCWFAQGALVQNYVEWPDESNAGMFGGMTCSTVWNKNGSVATEVEVNNFANTTTLTDNTKNWNREGWQDAEAWWQQYDADDAEHPYDVVYNSKFVDEKKQPQFASQACGAYGPLYGYNADGSVDPAYGNYYWEMKSVGTVAFTTGYRVYESASTLTPYNFAVGE